MRIFKPLQYISGDTPSQGVQYREYSPGEGLGDFIACYWSLESASLIQPVEHRVLPDGCIDIMFDLLNQRTEASGPLAETLRFTLQGPMDILGVRFLPRSIRYLLGAPDEVAGQTGDLRAVLQPGPIKRLLHAQSVGEVIMEAAGDRITQIQKLDQLFSRVFTDFTLSKPLSAVLDHAIATRGNQRVSELAGYHGVSEKQLGRYIRQVTGLSTKPFLQILRFQHLYATLGQRRSSNPRIGFVDTALDLGYYDQSHMINDLRRYLG